MNLLYLSRMQRRAAPGQKWRAVTAVTAPPSRCGCGVAPSCHQALLAFNHFFFLCSQEGVERVKEHLLSASGDGAICMVCL